MTLPPGSDLLLGRDRAAILAEILAARGSYVPDWLPTEGAGAYGLADITAGFLELLEERLARVPDHRHAVMLDLIGASVLPAQGARTHVLLTAVPTTRGARVPKGTRIGASVPGRSDPVVFETQETIAISPAVLVEVHSVQPAADAESDHSADVLARRPFTIFDGLARVERDLFIGDDELLAFDGRAVIELDIALSTAATTPLPIEWEWWDGTQWRSFTAVMSSPLLAGADDSIDGTAGLTRSGTVRLVAPVAKAKPLERDGRTTHWIRGRLSAPIARAATAVLPTISRLRLAVVNEHRRLQIQRSNAGVGAVAKVWWAQSLPESIAIHVRDLSANQSGDTYSATGTPPGFLPSAFSTDPLSLASRVGHSVRLGVSLAASRPQTVPATLAAEPRRVALDADDDLSDPVIIEADEQLDIAVARGLPLDKGIADQRAVDLTKTFAPLGPSPAQGTAFHFACETATLRAGSRVTLLIERPGTAAEEADKNADLQRDAARATKIEIDRIIGNLRGAGCVGALTAALAALDGPLPTLLGTALVDGAGNQTRSAAQWFNELRTPIASGIATALTALQQGETVAGVQIGALGVQSLLPLGTPPPVITAPAIVSLGVVIARIDTAQGQLSGLLDPMPGSPPNPLMPNGLLAMEPRAYVDAVKAKLATVRGFVATALATLTQAITDLEKISPAALAVELARIETTKLTPPQVEWEYHDGTRWRDLGAIGDRTVLSLLASGSLHFTVPTDIANVDVNGDVRRWLRARLAKGSYSHMSLVSWTDTLNTVNFLPVVEPRPPMIDRIEVFYTHRSSPTDASVVVAHDAHVWRDLTTAVRWPGPGGEPFTPMAERAPTLYLGLDGDLPADRIGLWIQPTSSSPWAVARRPLWEGWDGRAWTSLATDDGTDGLRRAGVVALNWPGTDGAPGAAVSGGTGRVISLLGRGAATRFEAGARLMIVDVQGQEPLVVSTAEGETVTTRAPLSRAYAGAQLVEAPPARFGVPRTWIRAVFDPTQPAPKLDLALLAAHAVEVAQVESLGDEMLGSGDGSPRQVLFARRFPFAGDVELEVRELDGDRADLDNSVLTRTLIDDGIDPGTVRLVRNARTSRITEVWVPWSAVRSLGSAGPQDRVFVPDRAQGRILFGGAAHGRPLPAGRDNVRLRSYQITEGPIGNVGVYTVNKVLSAVAIADVSNPVQASGGAAVEGIEGALRRSPALLRHRRLAVTERDVEAIAVEATPAVVRARALGARDQFGRPQPGAVRVAIVPRDGSDRPQPGAAVLAIVRAAIVDAMPAVAASLVTVEGPSYLPVGVSVTVLPLASEDAGAVRERVVQQLRDLMHPLRGGPDAAGWDFGAGAHISDLARALESVPGIDAVTDLELTIDGMTVGDSAVARPDQIVCAGPLIVRLGGGA